MDYDVDREAQLVASANAEYDKAYAKAEHEYKQKMATALQELNAAVADAQEKRDRQYETAHRGYYEALHAQGDMSDEARELLRRQLNGEVTWDSSLGEVKTLVVSDEAKAADHG